MELYVYRNLIIIIYVHGIISIYIIPCMINEYNVHV